MKNIEDVLENTLRELITEQSEGEWGSDLIEKDVKIFKNKIMEVFNQEIVDNNGPSLFTWYEDRLITKLDAFRNQLTAQEKELLPRIYFGFERLGIDPTTFTPVIFSWNGGASILYSHVDTFMGIQGKIESVIGAIQWHLDMQKKIPLESYHNLKYTRSVKKTYHVFPWNTRITDAIHNLLGHGDSK